MCLFSYIFSVVLSILVAVLRFLYLVSSSATLYTFSYTYHACVLYCLDVCITCHVFKVSAFVLP